ncbi:MAG: helix-turn-helix transcriptional regulator [Patescibacteria group bacterium]
MNDNSYDEEDGFSFNANSEGEEAPRRRSPLALHIRRLRQWYGETGIEQQDLAQIAGVSDRQLRVYERGRALPQSIEFLLSIALALGVPMEWLINPNRLEKIRQQIDERREAFERSRLGIEGSSGSCEE